VRWLQSLRDALPADDDASSLPIPDFSAPSPQRRAELAVYASPEVHALVQSIVSDGTPPHRGKRSSLPLHWQVEGAIDAIREKLQGCTPLPYEREPTRRGTRIHPQRWRIVISDQGIYPEVMHHAERDQARRGNGGRVRRAAAPPTSQYRCLNGRQSRQAWHCSYSRGRGLESRPRYRRKPLLSAAPRAGLKGAQASISPRTSGPQGAQASMRPEGEGHWVHVGRERQKVDRSAGCWLGCRTSRRWRVQGRPRAVARSRYAR
jgi:hypothetical protein